MARLSIKINLGPEASIGALSSVVGDLSVIQGLSSRLDRIACRRDAARRVEQLWVEDPTLLIERSLAHPGRSDQERHLMVVEQMRLREFPGVYDEMSSDDWVDALRELQVILMDKRKRPLSQIGLMRLASLAQPFAIPRLSDVSPDLYEDLVADEMNNRWPTVPAVERLVYENPFEIVLVIAVLGVAGLKYGSFVEFARLIRDWSADKQSRQHEANLKKADVRVRNAEASKAEAGPEVAWRFANQTSRIDDLEKAAPTDEETGAMSRTSDLDVEIRLDEDAA